MFKLPKKDLIILAIAMVTLMIYPYIIGLLGLKPEVRWLPFILVTMVRAAFYLPQHRKETQVTNK